MMEKFSVLRELLEYAKKEKQWFLFPFYVLVGILSMVAILAQTGSILLPFIYAGF